MVSFDDGANARPIAVTIGDPAGIGPELVLKAWLQRKVDQRPFFVLADSGHLSRLAAQFGWQAPIRSVQPSGAAAAFRTALPVVALHHEFEGVPKAPATSDAVGTIESMRRAVELVHQGEAAAIVTCPIAKDRLYKAGFQFPGHTEFLGAAAAKLWGGPFQAVMMLWSPDLAVVPLTVHVALKQVPQLLTEQAIITTVKIVIAELKSRFAIAHPRVALAGLNPHAGENATMGFEERNIIAPAIAILQAEGMNVSGPHPADTMFHSAARVKYDVAVCMYHDQALIPIKTLAFDHGVNITLGLPFVRTSPDHGTAFDIAGQGIANPASLIAALELAARLA